MRLSGRIKVLFPSEMAQAAIAEKNGTTYEGRTLAVQFADGEQAEF